MTLAERKKNENARRSIARKKKFVFSCVFLRIAFERGHPRLTRDARLLSTQHPLRDLAVAPAVPRGAPQRRRDASSAERARASKAVSPRASSRGRRNGCASGSASRRLHALVTLVTLVRHVTRRRFSNRQACRVRSHRRFRSAGVCGNRRRRRVRVRDWRDVRVAEKRSRRVAQRGGHRHRQTRPLVVVLLQGRESGLFLGSDGTHEARIVV